LPEADSTGAEPQSAKGRPRKKARENGFVFPIATKLVLGYLTVIVIISGVFIAAGIQLIGNRIVEEGQEKVRHDLNAAREIYLARLAHINDVVRLTADRYQLRGAIARGDIARATDELARVKVLEKLDILNATDRLGRVILRTNNPANAGDYVGENDLVRAVLSRRNPVSATMVISRGDLLKESEALAAQAYLKFISIPRERARKESEQTSGMLLSAAAPVFDLDGQFLGVLYGGTLLNRNYDIVDKVKQTVYEDLTYKGRDIGTATIFQDDVRISTNVRMDDGSRAVGTRIAEDVYQEVVVRGKPWIRRAYVVNNWYITAYEPIRDIQHKIIGVLYVGVLEEKFLDVRRRMVLFFLGITLAGGLISIALSYWIALRISIPLRKLVVASQQIAGGNLDARVEVTTRDELRELGETFNTMTLALKQRDRKLKEIAQKKVMESERLAIIGQLAAGVAHELNNPLQGIVTYAHLLLERNPPGNGMADSLNKIVTQAGRCRDIVRGLLDFSRPSKPVKKLTNVTQILNECVGLVENQALFHNIRIVRRPMENLLPVVADPSQIQQVLMNLIINAAEAMDGNGDLTLATRYDAMDKVVEIECTDTGRGIRPEDLERIFDPFFTTKEGSHGTGLGLAISYGIIREHRGSISVESEVGKGTTFTVRLPVVPQEQE
jgi:two-component system NtrC family sensor kinase